MFLKPHQKKKLEVAKIDGKKNTADLGTKIIDRQTLERLGPLAGLRIRVEMEKPQEAERVQVGEVGCGNIANVRNIVTAVTLALMPCLGKTETLNYYYYYSTKAPEEEVEANVDDDLCSSCFW